MDIEFNSTPTFSISFSSAFFFNNGRPPRRTQLGHDVLRKSLR